jgi:hypothetical protein
MARIPATPSVRTFVETWTTDFKAAVKQAAGKDGRLTLSEAQKLAKHPEADHVFADNAINYLKQTGKQSVGVETLAAEMKAYAERSARAAAGTDGRITLAEGAKLPGDLVEDFFLLRGKAVPSAVSPGGGTLAEVKAKLVAATAGVSLISETDAKFGFVSGSSPAGSPITADVVRAQLTAQHDATIGTLMYVDPADRSLAAKSAVEERPWSAFINRLTTPVDAEPMSIAAAKQFEALKQAVDANLTDVKVFRFGTITISTFIVGRTKTGELAGLLTGQVET